MALGKSLPPCEDFRIRSGAHREGHCKVEVKFFALQGGSSGRVDIQLKVLPDYKLLILKRNFYFNVNRSLSATRWATLYLSSAVRPISLSYLQCISALGLPPPTHAGMFYTMAGKHCCAKVVYWLVNIRVNAIQISQ